MKKLLSIALLLIAFNSFGQTPVFVCGAECGVMGTGGQHWQNGGNSSIVTSGMRSGSRCFRTNTTSASGFVRSNSFTAGTTMVGRVYVYFTTLPTTDACIIRFTNNTVLEGVYFKQSDSKLYTGIGLTSLGATGVTVTTGEWYRIDFKLIATGNPHTIDAQVNGSALGQMTRAVASSDYSNFDIGMSGGSITGDMYADDIVLSTTSGDYPYGAGFVNHFIPTSDGTHNIAGAGDFQRTTTGTDILNATTTAYQLLDDEPLETGAGVDWINLVAPPNATDYVECVFGPSTSSSTPTTAPRGVEVIAGIHQAATGTGNMEIRLNDNGTTNAVYTATTVAGVTSIAFKRKCYATAPTGGAWTVSSGAGNFNNIRVRFGSPAAVDANPDQYLDCIMIEAEFAPVSARPRRITSITKANFKISDSQSK